jgi:nucleoside-diphosphate-sugar epimerase
VADVSKLRNQIGYVPKTTLQEGLARTYAWFRDHEHLYGAT